ncbi:unnamed protein product [Caenorhabditis auriculariae]|uniref:RNA-directed DNA polymerase n=1 Tax=Caenorhabditis auriculariae TaxID=2777116 RepID=A0A8S1HXU6_9PELO|nr:unnamed protein product [Caenorhabditis auriculariae]
MNAVTDLVNFWNIKWSDVESRIQKHQYIDTGLPILHAIAIKEFELATLDRIYKLKDSEMINLIRKDPPYSKGQELPLERQQLIRLAYEKAVGENNTNIELLFKTEFRIPLIPYMTPEARREHALQCRNFFTKFQKSSKISRISLNPTTTSVLPSLKMPTATPQDVDTKKDRGPRNISISKEKQITPLPPVSGSTSDIEFLKSTYDFEENIRRNLTQSGINSKLQYTAEKLEDGIKSNFDKLYHSLCEANNRQLQIWTAVLQIDPTIGMRSLLGRQDISARVAGNGIYSVNQCRKIRHKKIYYDRKVNGTCFTTTPITTEDDEILFIVPGTQEIAHHAVTIPCGSVTPEIWKNNETFWTTTGQANFTNLPHLPSGGPASLPKLHFYAPDVYESAKSSSFPLLMAISFGKNLAFIQQKQSRMINVLHGTGLLSTETLRDLAAAGGYVVDKTTGTIGDVLEDVKNWYLMYLLWFGLPVFFLLSIGAFGYLIIKFWCTSKLLSINNVSQKLEMTAPPEAEASEEFEEDDRTEEVERKKYIARQRRLLPPLLTYIPIIIPIISTAATLEINSVGDFTTLPYLTITLNSRGSVALWDTGASVSYIPKSTLQYTNTRMNRACLRPAQTANGSTFQFLGSVLLSVSIGGHEIKHKFLVSRDEDCPAPALIGYDFIAALDERNISTSLHPKEGTLEIGSTKVKLLKKGEEAFVKANKKINVLGAETKTIPPFATKTLNLKLVDDNQIHFVLLKPTPGSALTFLETLVRPGLTSIQATNRTNKPLKIQKGMFLGKADAINTVDNFHNSDPQQNLEPYTPPEADWEAKLPNSPKDFISELDLNNCDLNENQQEILKKIIIDNKAAFFNEDGQIGKFIGPVQHSIPIRTDMPFPKARTYKIPFGKRDEVDRQVEELLNQKIIEPSQSLFTSPVVLVRKKDLTWRFTVDYRQLNNVTKKQTYLIPTITDIIDLAVGAKFFTNVDLISGFFQINLREEDRPLTAFTTTHGTWQFTRMAMGLCGAPHTFQSAVRYLQQQMPRGRLFTYLDDLLLTSDSAEEHLKDIEALLETTSKLGFKIRLSKCHFACPSVTFLGLIISRDGVLPNPKKVEALENFPKPKSPTAVRSFLGMTNYFRRFVKNYAQIASPLYDLTKEKEEFSWKESHEKAFQELKNRLTTAPILVGPMPSRPYQIETDASCIAIGAVLLQSRADGEPFQAIAYASRKLRPAERNYPAIEAEALALVFALSEFRTYVLGSRITAIVDHRPLTSLMTRRDLIGRLAKFQIILAEFDIQILYRPGKQNVVPDALSRYLEDETREPIQRKEKVANVDLNPKILEKSETISLEEIRNLQKNSLWIRQAIEEITKPEESTTRSSPNHERYTVHEGLCETALSMPPAADRPAEKQRNPQTGAHLGAIKTGQAIKRRLIWTGLDGDVKNFVKECLKCRKRKTDASQTTREPLNNLPVENEPGKKDGTSTYSVHCQSQPNKNRYVLTLVDAFTKWFITVPLITQDSSSVIRAIVENLITKFADVTWKTPMPVYLDLSDHTTLIRIQLQELWKHMKKEITQGQILQKKDYEKTHRIRNRKICPGDSILVKRAAPRNKLSPFLSGPFTVTKVDETNVHFDQNGKIMKTHQDDARLFKRKSPEAEVPLELPENHPLIVEAEINTPTEVNDTRRPTRQHRIPIRFRAA